MRPRKVVMIAAVLLVAVVALGAWVVIAIPKGPTYPLDYFYEMHYSPAVRPGEPARLSIPDGAVPITGGTVDLQPDQAKGLQNPVPKTPDNLRRAGEIYQANCRPCHGPDGRGDGFVSPYFAAAGMNPPVDYAGPQERSLSDGEIWAIIGTGIRGMPPFGKLLTSEERWLLVHEIRTVQEGAR